MNKLDLGSVLLIIIGLLLTGVVAEDLSPIKIDPLKVDNSRRGGTVREKALEYLKTRGEVILLISISSSVDIDTLAKITSIDKIVNDSVVRSYLNKDEFDKFEKHGYEYKVLIPESMQIRKLRGDNRYDSFKTRDDINTFPSYTGYVNIMKAFAADYPEICRLENIGSSVRGRDILFLVISDSIDQEEAEPKVVYTSTMHGDETVGMIVYLKLIQHLLENYDSDSEIKEIVDNVETWICPNLNPDGTYDASNGQSQYGAKRYNANNIDINRCFPGVSQPNGVSITGSPELMALLALEKECRFYIGADSHGGIEALVMPWTYQKGIPAPANRSVWKELGLTFSNSLQQIFVCENGPYAAPGTKPDFGYFMYSSVQICPELSNIKPIQEGQFDYQWNRFSRGFIDVLKEAMYGVHGVITDINTGEYIDAKITMSELDSDGYGTVATHNFGDFYHTATTGTYDITITPEDSKYGDTTLTDIAVQSGAATYLTIELGDHTGAISSSQKGINSPSLSISKLNNGTMKISYKTFATITSSRLYNASGKFIRSITLTNKNGVHEGIISPSLSRGNYFLKIKSDTETLNKKIVM